MAKHYHLSMAKHTRPAWLKFCIYTANLSNQWNRIPTKILDMFRIITLSQNNQSDPILIRQFSKKVQSDPVLIRAKLASVLIQSDPVLIRAHLCSASEVRRAARVYLVACCKQGGICNDWPLQQNNQLLLLLLWHWDLKGAQKQKDESSPCCMRVIGNIIIDHSTSLFYSAGIFETAVA